MLLGHSRDAPQLILPVQLEMPYRPATSHMAERPRPIRILILTNQSIHTSYSTANPRQSQRQTTGSRSTLLSTQTCYSRRTRIERLSQCHTVFCRSHQTYSIVV